MHRSHPAARAGHRPIGAGLSALVAAAVLFGGSRPVAAQMAPAPAAATEEAEPPHPFFTHMGLPEGVGNFNLRLLGITTRADGLTDGDFAFHFETGLTKSIGLHIRNDRFLGKTRSEVMFQFAAVVNL